MKRTGETGNLLSPDARITLATPANTDNLSGLTEGISQQKNHGWQMTNMKQTFAFMALMGTSRLLSLFETLSQFLK